MRFRLEGLGSGESWAISSDLTLNGGLYREQCQNGLKLEIEIILNYIHQYIPCINPL